MANLKFQNACAHVAQKCPPIWFMRQAGRYHRHYQKLKEKHDFMQLCKEPELAAEVAMGPMQDFDFDVAILFSDLLFPLEALGMGLTYAPGPKFERPLVAADLQGDLPSLEEALAKLEFQRSAMTLTRERLPQEKSLIGFVGGPWTLFAYACGGTHDGHLIAAKSQPQFFVDFCDVMVPLLIENIRLQLDGGAEVVMIFDTAAGEVSPVFYKKWIAPRLLQLAKAHPGRLGYYSKGTTADHLRDSILQSALWAGVGVDHRWDLSALLPHRETGFTQGNFDQAFLFADEDQFKNHLRDFIAPLKDLPESQRRGWVCGLGHGVLPQTPEKHVRLFVDTIRREFS